MPQPEVRPAWSRRGVLTGLGALAGCSTTTPKTDLQGGAAPPPAALVKALDQIAGGFNGRYGISVRSLQAGWTAAHDGEALYPQQSVAKLWTALAVFDAVDKGRLTLDQVVHVTAADMSVFHQPIRDRLVGGALDVTVDALLTGAIVQSDNACDDILIRLVGGDAVVQQAVDARTLGGIRAGPQERMLQSWIAGLAWSPDYTVADAFERTREHVDMQLRRERLAAYLADPPEGATPNGLTAALARLQAGALLSPASTARFLRLLSDTTTGPLRLKGGLPPGWAIAHKTGTGQDLGEVSTGYNDVALVTAPDGRGYAIAAMIASTTRPVAERMELMQATSRAVAVWHDASRG